ncbi:hypothetical protein BMG00_17310 [Thioclava marina]|uniref:DUF11 domain-containing protein n=1 Tax=Thioclava marina TaxID=1915077 RepID=A0ABX3MH67_9RHOB|nr:GEVED domain-containing protein [Thioclava marina]OOY10914.1 hypothetical protein BMG00_17310 [Thioclava marina]
MFKPVSRLSMPALSLPLALAGALAFAAAPVKAGEFTIDWGAFDWPAGFKGPLDRTLYDQYGFAVDVRVEVNGPLVSFVNGSGQTVQSPDDDLIFGGNIESLILVADAPLNGGAIGDNRIINTVSASSGGVAVQVDNLRIDVLDIDATDNNATSDRCDFVTAFGDNGNPTLTALSPTPSIVVGPGPGSGLTGTLSANQAQCIYNEGPTGSPTSPNDYTGTVRANFPNGTSSVTFWYDESIQNVRNYPVFQNYNPGARGIGMFAEAFFTVDQSISLSRSVSPASAIAGDTLTYTYIVTNTGTLPFNTGQDVVIEDSQLGTVSCPAITAPVAPGGSLTCSAAYTVSVADALAGNLTSTATAGIGAIGSDFVNRLPSNSVTLPVPLSEPNFGSGPLSCQPTTVFSKPRTQIAGPGSAAAPTLADIFVFDNVTSDKNGNPVDVTFQLTSVNNATEVQLDSSIQARMVPTNNGYLTYKLRLVKDGTATVANPQGEPIDQSGFNGLIVMQTDVDSLGASDDSSDVVGPVETPNNIIYFNTAPLASFPAPGTPIAMDPAKVGDPTNWIDEPNETAYDNYATYEFDTFVEASFIHGYTGTSTNSGLRGSQVLLCAIADTSATVIARDDDYTSTPINALAGGTAGDVYGNDTINGLLATAVTADLTVLAEAQPLNAGDPVPYLVTSGLDEGRVVVPSSVPAGIYTIDYELCDTVTPADCDRARVTIAVYDGDGLDFGDAPVNYLIASHAVSATQSIYLGTVPPDAELVAQSDSTATADDLLGVDDEDAVTFPALTQGMITTIDVLVTGDAFLQGWIDFNGDGVFEETLGERIATDLRDDGTGSDAVAGDGVIQITVTVPSDATTSATFARFRYSSQQGLLPVSLAPDGEVEDYTLLIAAADLVDRGDAPASYGDPRHIVVPDIYLGLGLPDTEVVQQNSVSADADDLAGIDDEDAIAAFPNLVGGTTTQLTVVTHETLSIQYDLGLPVTSGITNLQLWVDFNRNGVFDASEQVAIDYRDGGTGDLDGVFNNQITLDIPVPANAVSGQSYARLRWSTSSALTSDPFDGLNLDGEVEDYLVTITNPNGPFACTDTFYMVATETAQNLPALSELMVTESGGVYTLSQTLLPPDYTGNYLVTGWGFNELDGYIYGVRQSPRTLMRITASGAVQEVADISGLTIESPDTSSDILPNGVMVYMSGTNFGHYQLLDISDPLNPVALGILDTGQSTLYGRDIAYNPRDGLLYFIDSNRNIYAIDPLGGTPGATTITAVGNVPLPAGIFAMDPDSVWFDGSGFLYLFDNQTRQVFAVEVGTEGNRPASFSFIEVEGTVADLTYQGNDGASCRAPGPFTSTVFVEGSISGRLYVDANLNSAYDAGETAVGAITVTLYDDNGTPADPADDIQVATTESAADGTYSFATVDATKTYRIEVDAADTDTPAGYLVATTNPLTGVVVTQGADTSDQNFGYAEGAQSADLSVSLAITDPSGTPLTEAAAGATIEIRVSVTNDGPSGATGVQVRDLLPDGYSYVSDDAAALGDSYDPSTGIWDIGAVASGETVTLAITVTMNATGEHTNAAEIVAADQPDPDSDPAVGALTDDLADGIADDDEAFATIALSGAGGVLSGTVFLDNGAGGVAYDGVPDAGEPGSAAAKVEVFDAGGVLIDTPEIAADGTWSLVLPDGYAGEVTVQVTAGEGHQVISETPTALPGKIDTDPRDGAFTFTVAAGTDYAGLDVGLLREARLSESQSGAISAGQVVMLYHRYTADGSGLVDFSVTTISETPTNGYSVGLFQDLGCDGSTDVAITGPLPTAADTEICLVARVSASSALGPNASYVFQLDAATSYGATGVSEIDSNTDRLVSSGQVAELKLSKTVRNVTKGGAEGLRNGGAPGDILEYRIAVENPTALPASEVKIYDRTPPYTTLAGAVPSPIAVGGMSCTLAEPAANAAGYAGNLRWDCTGLMLPGASGAVSFEVRITP